VRRRGGHPTRLVIAMPSRVAPSDSWKATSVATGDAPVLEALIDINAVSLARAELDPATLLLVRTAALAAVDAPAASYLMHVGPAVESGVKVEQVQDVLVAVAPIIGAPRVLSAATKITEALGIAIAVAEMAAEVDAGASTE
jgi:alkylhydroperoxidase/carboxymuconolactone decarboxylase family protein YurZ